MPPTFTLPNTAISASAGSGKTFQLAHRFIGLLVAGFAPERIIALTFSRKAASEMFDRIIQALCDGAESDTGTTELLNNLRASQAIPPDTDITREHVLLSLRRTLEAMHRIRVGTLDSFFTGVLQAFPFEFGLGGEISILEGHAEVAARRQALDAVLRETTSPAAATADFDDLTDFLEEFKQATYGQEGKSFSAQVDQFIESAGTLFTEAPEDEQWGDEQRIWAQPSPWLTHAPPPLHETVRIMRECLASMELNPTQQKQWDEFLTAAQSFGAGSTMTDIKKMLEKLMPVTRELAAGHADIAGRPKLSLHGTAATTAADLVYAIVNSILTARLKSTAGIHCIMKRFDEYYHDLIRSNGALTFGDVLAVLVGNQQTLTAHDHDTADNRLYVNYRLDAQFDHWLLDEFQDTSTLQWKALQTLADEVLQDPSLERSLFYVGDVKQAIYGWRGGDSRLFHSIRGPYGDRITLRNLTESYRSSQPVIDAVNGVFDRLDERMSNADVSDPIPAPVLERWKNAWGGRHKTAKKDIAGFAKIISVARPKRGDPLSLLDRRLHVLVEELRKLHPETSAASIGILARTNKNATEIAQSLRDQGFDVALEGAFPLVDNPVVAAFVSLVKCTAYPDDSFAIQHVQMTPWRDRFNAWPTSSARIRETLGTIHNHGFQPLAKEWLNAVRDTLDEFGRHRATKLLQATGEFDATGNRNIADFLDFITEYNVADSADNTALKVMTVHKSKGLQFDAVFLPTLDGSSSLTSARRNPFMVKRSESLDRDIEWILDAPPKIVVENDPVLNDCHRALAQDACYEELCTLYVAMTRAKHALYIIQDQPSSSSKSLYPSTLVRLGLADENPIDTVNFDQFSAEIDHLTGDPDWINSRHTAPTEATPPHIATPVVQTVAARPPRPRRLTPSGSEDNEINAGRIFHAASTTATDVGDVVHSVMSEIDWLTESITLDTVMRTSQTLNTPLPPEIRERSLCELRKLLDAPMIREALKRPDDRAEVWREKRFEVLLDNGWLSGCFDRVVIIRTEDGDVSSAMIQDYKTSRIPDANAFDQVRRTYTPQMTAYRAALARILAVSESAIACQLLLTDSGDVLLLNP